MDNVATRNKKLTAGVLAAFTAAVVTFGGAAAAQAAQPQVPSPATCTVTLHGQTYTLDLTIIDCSDAQSVAKDDPNCKHTDRFAYPFTCQTSGDEYDYLGPNVMNQQYFTAKPTN